jgi:glycosyltransferase involved in cell wall biosynthesis
MSTPTVSFVVPTRNSARTIAACVMSLRNQTYPQVEIVVVDNESTDDTGRRATEAGADLVVIAGPERCAQRNRGARESRGEIVVFIDSDMVLEPAIASQIVEQFEQHPELGALIIPEQSFGDGFWTKCRVLEKSLYVGNESVEAARAFRREVFEEVGGWNEALTAAEDWDLDDRIRNHGVQVGRVEAFIWHDEGKLRLRGTFGKKRYYGQWIAAYLDAHDDGSRRIRRSGLLDKKGDLLRHPILTTGMVTLKSVEAAGIYAGMRDARSQRTTVLPGVRA